MPGYVDLLSTIAIVLFVISTIPQIWKLSKNKTARDVSLWMSVLIAAGNGLMLVRAIGIHDRFFQLNYAFQLVLWLVIVVLVLKFRSR
ncbi:MAG TPA: PQ-loop repeat-containing protein [Patescibacteria group bacterium]|nr:PQ-loop repeat-containing protein [Patescibacteria group bacterium]